MLKSKKIKSLVIGAGSIGLRHINILEGLGHNTALVTKRKDVDFTTYLKTEFALKSFDPDYIIIANETYKHINELEQVHKFSKNKIILVEKPIFNNLNNIDTFKFSKNNIFVGYNLRYHFFIKFIQKLQLKENILSGNIYVGQYLPDWRPNSDYKLSYSADTEKGGGVLLELSHEFDYLLLLFGKCIKSFALIDKLSDLKINCNDSVVGILKFEQCKQISYNFNLIDKLSRREIILNTNYNTYKFDLVNNIISTNNNYKKYDLNIDETYKEMHLDILYNKGKNACSFQKGVEVLNFINDTKVL